MKSEIQNPKSKIIQNVLWMAWSGAISIANSVAVWVFMARLREPDEIGRFTIVMSLYMLFFTICSLGLSPFIVNEISRLIGENDEDQARSFISTTTISLLILGNHLRRFDDNFRLCFQPVKRSPSGNARFIAGNDPDRSDHLRRIGFAFAR